MAAGEADGDQGGGGVDGLGEEVGGEGEGADGVEHCCGWRRDVGEGDCEYTTVNILT